MTTSKPTITERMDDRNRLALLWKAFEEAELRIGELESELDRRRAAPAAQAVREAPRERVDVDDAQEGRAAAEKAREELTRTLMLLKREHEDVLRELAEERAARARVQWERDVANGLFVSSEASVRQLEDKLRALEAWAREPRAPIVLAPRARVLAPASRLYPIDANRVGEIHGVRPDEVAALRGVGINFADALLYADLAAVHGATGIGLPRLAKLRGLAELMAIRGIGPEWAEWLYRSGLRGIDDVVQAGAEGLEALLLTHAKATMDEHGQRLAQRTLSARAEAILAACRPHV